MISVKLPSADAPDVYADEARAPPDRTLALFFDKILLRADAKNSSDRSPAALNTISLQASVMQGGLYCDDVQFAVSVDPAGAAARQRGGEWRDAHRHSGNGVSNGSAFPPHSARRPRVLVLGPDTYSLAEINHVDLSGKLVVETVAAPARRAEASGVARGNAAAGNGAHASVGEGRHHPLCNERSVRIRQVDLVCDAKLVQVTIHRCSREGGREGEAREASRRGARTWRGCSRA